MSKEVSVTGINMTATVPENYEISLGSGQLVAAGTSVLNSGSVGAGSIAAPTNSDESTDWSNTVAFSDCYQVGKLIPASSNTGATIYYTHDATGQGKTINESGTSTAATSSDAATLTRKTTAGNVRTTTGDDGYYVDFPVWFRSSNAADSTMSVHATVTDGSNESAEAGTSDFLYKAARVSILTGKDMTTSAGVIIPKDSADGTSQGAYYTKTSDSKPAALATNGTLGVQGTGAAYGAVTEVTQNTLTSGSVTTYGTALFTVPGKTATVVEGASGTYSHNGCTDSSDNYGDAVCVIVRVWLEGEDVNCWNATAGQDFDISLNFTKVVSG